MENRDQPAYPHSGYKYATGKPEGLTKREYFAGLAMQGMLANPSSVNDSADQSTSFVVLLAQASIKAADELLTQLNK